MIAADWQDPVTAAADADTLTQWRKAQELAAGIWAIAANPGAADFAAAHLPASMRGLRRLGNPGGGVFVPMRDMGGALWGLQPLNGWHPDRVSVADAGTPRIDLRARVQGLHYWHGPPVNDDGAGKIIGIVEHVHDAVMWRSESGTPCAVGFWPENFAPLASALCLIYPAAALVFWALRGVQERPMRDAAIATGAHVVFGSDGPDRVRPLLRQGTADALAGGET